MKIHLSIIWSNGTMFCFPKDFGGMGVINTRRMNEALLSKWIWRIIKNRENDACVKLLRSKYLNSKPFSLSSTKGDRNSGQGSRKSNTFLTGEQPSRCAVARKLFFGKMSGCTKHH